MHTSPADAASAAPPPQPATVPPPRASRRHEAMDHTREEEKREGGEAGGEHGGGDAGLEETGDEGKGGSKTRGIGLGFSPHDVGLEKRWDEGVGFSPRTTTRSTPFFTQTQSAMNTATWTHPDGWPRRHPPNWKGTT